MLNSIPAPATDMPNCVSPFFDTDKNLYMKKNSEYLVPPDDKSVAIEGRILPITVKGKLIGGFQNDINYHLSITKPGF